MIQNLPDWVQVILFVGLCFLWLRLAFDFIRWLWRAIIDEGMM